MKRDSQQVKFLPPGRRAARPDGVPAFSSYRPPERPTRDLREHGP